MRALVLAVCLSSVSCVVGTIDGEVPSGRRVDGGPSVGGNTGDDLPPADDEPAPPPPADAGSDAVAPPPPADTGATDTGTKETAPPLAYPSGPYGLGTGQILPDLVLSGYHDGTGSWTTVSTRDFYDPTGARGVHALLVVSSAAWCSPCREEAKDLVDLYATTYRARGARFLGAMIESESGAPATRSTVDLWVAYAKTNFDIVADPSQKLFRSGASLPFNFVVDPRTMKIVKAWSGTEPGATSIPEVDAVLEKNGAY